MLEINAPFTNVTLQTFASEGDLALCNQKWEKLGPKFVNRLEKKRFVIIRNCYYLEQRLQIDAVCYF